MTLIEGLTALLARPVDTSARQRARWQLSDWLGYAAAAVDSKEGRLLTAYARSRPPGSSTTILTGRHEAGIAAFVNAGLGLVLELDDVHRRAKLHPGPVVIPAALALAESIDATVDQLLDAIVRGYEAMIRIGESVGEEHYRYWHTTSTCGTFGAAAAAGSLLNLDGYQLANALGNAGTQSAGLWQCRPEKSMSKPLHAGRAARSGLDAAELASGGLTGPHRILEGEQGLYAATCPDADPSAVLGGSATWRIHDTSIKPWAGCRHIHPTIAAALELRDPDTSPVPRELSGVEVHTYAVALDFADQPNPASVPESLFSLQHAAAWAIVHGEPDERTFTVGGIADPDVRTLRQSVTVHCDSSLDARYPTHWGARVVATGPRGARQASAWDAPGDPERPLTEEQMGQKASTLLRQAGSRNPDGIVHRCQALAGDRPATVLVTDLSTPT